MGKQTQESLIPVGIKVQFDLNRGSTAKWWLEKQFGTQEGKGFWSYQLRSLRRYGLSFKKRIYKKDRRPRNEPSENTLQKNGKKQNNYERNSKGAVREFISRSEKFKKEVAMKRIGYCKKVGNVKENIKEIKQRWVVRHGCWVLKRPMEARPQEVSLSRRPQL